MKARVSAVVLAGGLSSRFGSDKALAPWSGRTLVERVVRRLRCVARPVIVVAKDRTAYSFLAGPGVRLVRDRLRRRHPLAGLEAGLAASPTPFSFVCACDMPMIRPGIVRRLRRAADGCDVVVPLWRGRPQTLGALYSRSCLPAVRRLARRRRASLKDLLGMVRTRTVTGEDCFLDVDTRAAYRAARRRHGG